MSDGSEEHRSAALRRRGRDLASGFARALVIFVALSITVIGFPFAIRQLMRYQFMAPIAMLDGLDGRRSLARSSELVRTRWLHTAVVVGIVYTVLGGFGLVVGLALLIAFTGLPLWTLSMTVTMCNVLVMPLGGIVVTMLYGNAVAEDADRDDGARVTELVGRDA